MQLISDVFGLKEDGFVTLQTVLAPFILGFGLMKKQELQI
jgi:hypothetical protein